MTKKLYYDDPFLAECRAKVVEVKPVEGGYEIATDCTVIYPEGGGQLSGTGFIDDIPALSAREEGGTVWHFTREPVRAGGEVTLRADMRERLEHSQLHTGEHILSGLAKKMFDVNNVGFHMAADYVSVDFDKPLTEAHLKELEDAVNGVIFAAVPVKCEIFPREELAAELEREPLRKPISDHAEGDIRIVTIAGADRCACCGTQLLNTAQTGLLKITAAEHYKGGMRIYFAAGLRALEAHREKQEIVSELAKRFSTKEQDVPAAVVRQGDELNACKRELKARTAALMRYIAKELYGAAEEIGGTKLIVSVQKGFSAGDLKPMTESILALGKSAVMIFVPDGENVRYALACSEGAGLSMKDAAAAVNAALNGKGGGRDSFAQGSAPMRPGFEQAVEQLAGYFSAVLKK